MEKIKKIAGINLLILAAYSLGISVGNQGKGLAIVLFVLFLMTGQVMVNLVIGIIQYMRGEKALGHAFMISLALIVILGISTYYTAISVFESGV